MKRCSVSATFPSLTAHKSGLSSAAVGSNATAAAGKALRKLLAHPALKGKSIDGFKATFSFSAISLDEVEKKFADEAEPEPDQPIDLADIRPAQPDPLEQSEFKDPNRCKYCGESQLSLVRHLNTCTAKPQNGKEARA